jgi:ribosomal protein S12 methylthiotransferase accessory factor
MGDTHQLLITLDGGRRITAHLGRHHVHTDQPVKNGGEDSAPAPFDVFLAAIGTCAGVYVQGFCATRRIDAAGIVIREWPRYDAGGTLQAVELAIELPDGFPERYRAALVRVVEQCAVKRAIDAHPQFLVRIAASPPVAVAAH